MYIDDQDIQQNKGFGILISLFSILFFLPLVMEDKKGSAYLKFRANQSAVLFICSLVCGAVGAIPLIGFVGDIAALVVGILSIVNLVYAIMGSTKPTPLLGNIVILK